LHFPAEKRINILRPYSSAAFGLLAGNNPKAAFLSSGCKTFPLRQGSVLLFLHAKINACTNFLYFSLHCMFILHNFGPFSFA